ncbi:hypothetical protein AHAS_Ahas17G0180400 [Arachis hypogaea]
MHRRRSWRKPVSPSFSPLPEKPEETGRQNTKDAIRVTSSYILFRLLHADSLLLVFCACQSSNLSLIWMDLVPVSQNLVFWGVEDT